jgi:hypothetical protein
MLITYGLAYYKKYLKKTQIPMLLESEKTKKVKAGGSVDFKFPGKMCIIETDEDIPYDLKTDEKLLAVSDSGNNRVIVSKLSYSP